jgi:hypothetical protein
MLAFLFSRQSKSGASSVKTVADRDVGVERPGMGLQRVLKEGGSLLRDAYRQAIFLLSRTNNIQ